MADSTTPATQITQYQTGYAPEIAPYAQGLLGQAAATTYKYDASQIDPVTGMPKITGFQPYQAYTGDQTAQFSPLQQQSYAGAQNMQTAPQLGGATQLAGMAGLGALGTNYGYQTQDFTAPGVAKQYMNPYISNVMDVQTQQANRQAQIQNAANNAQATTAGAFGGGRQAIMGAQNNADLQRNLANIQATGLNNAYTQGAQQFNTQQQLGAQNAQFGANLGLQGLNTALQGANTLGNLGQTQYGQQMGINELQNQYGGQQQQQMQNILNNQYQNFLNAQNYPYKQMGFLSDLINKLPMSAQSQTMYQAPPSALSQIGGAGLTAAALLRAKGGAIKESHGIQDLALAQMGA